jgi:PAS domain S-box-containing protein
MRIKQKLLISFMALSFLTLGVSYLSVLAIQEDTIASFQKVGGEIMPGNIALARMTTELYHTLELVSRFSEEQNAEDEKNIEKALSTLATFKTMYLLYLPEEKEWHEKIDASIQRFNSYITEYILLMKRGGTEGELNTVTDKIDEILDEFVSSVTPHIEGKFSESLQRLEATKKRGLQAKRILIISGLLILVITLCVSLYISHLLAEPIRKLRDAALEIGEGRLDLTLQPTSNDEIGELAGAFNDMTANLSLAREELITARDYIDNIVRSMVATLIVTSPTGTIERVNSTTCLLLGYREQELVGRSVHHFIVTKKNEELFRKEELSNLVGKGLIKNLDVFLRTKDGGITPVLISGSTMLDRRGDLQAVIIVARDIREISNLLDELNRTNKKLKAEIADRLLIEKALKKSEENYREIFNATNEAIFIHDSTTGVILDVNQTMLDMYGYAYDEALKLTISDLSSNELPYTQAEGIGFVKGAVAHGPQLFDWRARRKNGELFWVEVALKSTEIGGLGRVLAVVRDVSDRKQIEEELRQAQKIEAIGTLAGGIAHDFNNILTVIFGYTELARMRAENDPMMSELLEEVFKAGEQARNLVTQILTFSRRTEQEKKPLQLATVIQEALGLLRSTIPTTIEIRENIQSQHKALADPTQIHQIVMNLCTNAYHSMLETGGVLAVSLQEINLLENDYPTAAIEPGRYLQLEVSDNGKGMDGLTKEKIFEPYFTTKEASEGTGLGLAVVHGIVKDHNGHISVYSEPGQGTTFHVYLPITEMEGDGSAGKTTESHPQGGTERIMVIDDEEIIVKYLRTALANHGYKITAYTNGLQALQDFSKRPGDYDLVITDMTMPYMTGAELAQQLLELRSDLPIILCSGYSELINKEKAKAMGIADYLQKPLVTDGLLKAIRNVLNRRLQE